MSDMQPTRTPHVETKICSVTNMVCKLADNKLDIRSLIISLSSEPFILQRRRMDIDCGYWNAAALEQPCWWCQEQASQSRIPCSRATTMTCMGPLGQPLPSMHAASPATALSPPAMGLSSPLHLSAMSLMDGVSPELLHQS